MSIVRASGFRGAASTPSTAPRARRSRFTTLRTLVAIAAGAAITAFAAPAAADVSLHVAAGPDGIRPGEMIDLEVTVANDDSGFRSGLTLELLLPTNISFVGEGEIEGDCAGSTCDAGELLSFTFDVPPSSSRTFRYPFFATGGAPAGAVLEFPATLLDGIDVEAEATASVTVAPDRRLELAITEDRDPVEPGQRIEYSIGWGLLAGGSGSPGTTLGFPVPAGATFVSASGGGSLAAGTVEWNLGSLAPGETGERRVVLEVDPGTAVGTILASTATLANAFGQSTDAMTATPVAGSVPLDVRIVASPDPARPGEPLDLEITVSNPGAFEVFDVVARVDMPAGMPFFGDAEWGVDCAGSTCDANERIFITVGDLDAGESRTYTLPVSTSGSFSSGRVVRFDADVIDSFGFFRGAGALVRISGDRQLELTMAEDRDPVVAGEDITWTLTWGNRATGAGAFGTQLELPVPVGATFVDATGGGTLVGDRVVWDLGVVAPGKSGEERARFTMDPLGEGTLVSARATLAADDATTVAAETATRVAADLPLELVIAATPDPVRPGEPMEVELTVSNRGAQPRFNVEVRLDMPDEVGFFSEGNADASCPGSTCDAGERARHFVDELAPGEGRTWTVPLQLAGGITAGRVILIEGEVLDATGRIREVAANVVVADDRTAELVVVGTDDPVRAGDSVTWTLTWGTRAGGDGSDGATVALRLPEGTSFESATDGGALQAEPTGDRVHWSVGALSPGTGGERRVTLLVDPALPAGSILTADGWFDEGDGSAAETVRAVETTRTEPENPLDVEVTAGGQPAAPGSALDVTISVRNTGTTAREGVSLRFEYPEQFGFVSDSLFAADCPGSTCDAGERAILDIGTLMPGETVEFVVPGIVSNSIVAGSVITFDADAFDATGIRGRDGDAVMVGTTFRIANPGDATNDGLVDIFDLLAIVSNWGACPEPDACPQDFSGDGIVGIDDLLVLLSNFS